MFPPMYGFVLIPDPKNLRQIVELNNNVFPASPLQLDKEYFLPHCTILQAPISRDFNYQKFLAHFSKFYGFVHEPRTVIGDVYQEGKTVLVDVVNARWLSDFNEHIVNLVSEFIEVPPAPVGMVFDNESQKRSYELTGYKRNLDAYSPHFTVAVNENDEKFSPEDFIKINNAVRFTKLAFCKHGKHGRIDQIVSQVALPSQWD